MYTTWDRVQPSCFRLHQETSRQTVPDDWNHRAAEPKSQLPSRLQEHLQTNSAQQLGPEQQKGQKAKECDIASIIYVTENIGIVLS